MAQEENDLINDGVVLGAFSLPTSTDEAVRVFERLGSLGGRCTEEFVTGFKGAFAKTGDAPDEVELEFGFKLEAGVGIKLVEYSTHADVRVKAVWKKDRASSQVEVVK
jgi:hypothetical protein